MQRLYSGYAGSTQQLRTSYATTTKQLRNDFEAATRQLRIIIYAESGVASRDPLR